jgi:NAD(P)H-dependent flavin oxidoreductase YrpB (nitropropane dioxygenase family)
MAAALAAGADAVRVGTRFLATREADVHPAYQQAVIDAAAEDTVLTTVFDLGWPDAPHRVLTAAADAGGPGRSPLPPGRGAPGDVASMALYAGQSAGAVRAVVPAGDVVRELCDEAERLLRRWGSDGGRRTRG